MPPQPRGPLEGRLHIAFAASEAVPYVKTGGLADVAGALPRALAALGHRVTSFLPRYASIEFPPGEFRGSAHVPLDGAPRSAGFYSAVAHEGVETVFVEHAPLLERRYPYGEAGADYPDNHLRFAFFSRAVLEYFRARGERPSVFHVNDWQTALLPVYLKAFYWNDPTLHRLPTLLTLHNLAYQGVFADWALPQIGLPRHLGSEMTLGQGGEINYLKGGLLFAESLSAVSPRYSREIQGGELGCGLDGILRSRSADLHGILNGVDYAEWDPRVDPHIVSNYSAEDLSGKKACKSDVLEIFGLPGEPEQPLIGIVSRLIKQKGFDFVVEAWWDLLKRPFRLIVLGSGEPEIEDGFRALAARAPDRMACRLTYDPLLAHRVQAGADMFLMPSRYEPCGLTQMYSLRYGTVPIVRATGGLADTVEEYQPETGEGTGFRFDDPDGTGLVWAIDQALEAYRNKPAWEILMKAGMARDFSWRRSAELYVDVYREAATRA